MESISYLVTLLIPDTTGGLKSLKRK